MIANILKTTGKIFKRPQWNTFEFGDLEKTPQWYHLYLRKYLVFFYNLFGYYKLWIPSFEDYIKAKNPEKILELCAGSGDALPLIVSKMKNENIENIQFKMSDLKPNKEFIEKYNSDQNNQFTYSSTPVDASRPTAEQNCPKLFINSFHHFPENLARTILHNNLKNGNDIIIFEYVKSSFLGYISMVAGTFVSLLTIPFVVKLKHLPLMIFFTYLIPLFPLMFLWDGITSCYRAYTTEDIKELVKSLPLKNIEVTNDARRSLLYPAGTNAIYITTK